ncbi:MAG: hypothetical protein GF355_07015, partial [Candidatus Eisenbacteria bacterium]|nr:hypothetical protein [Candidatus Eisenbacteria bacterium]
MSTSILRTAAILLLAAPILVFCASSSSEQLETGASDAAEHYPTDQMLADKGSVAPPESRPVDRQAQALDKLSGEPQEPGEYGDAPEGALAYPASGINGQFPTCAGTGPAGFVYHQPIGWAYFGPMADFEVEGNAGNCPNFPPYDADECFADPDAGLIVPPAYTIQGGVEVPCDPSQTGPLGPPCATAVWGVDIDIHVVNTMPVDGVVNVLLDWSQDGAWQGSSQCPGGLMAAEHVLVNFPVPMGFSGPLSALGPPSFLIGPNTGYVWTRFTISETPVVNDWDGSASFEDGESEDYMLLVGDVEPPEEGDYGDAPEGATAYPSLGVSGQFPTCRATGPAGFVYHQPTGWAFFGPMVDFELDGNAGNCPNFPPYDADECYADPDAGLMVPPAYTIQGGAVVPCDPTQTGPLGAICATAAWGVDVDIHVVNTMPVDGLVNVLMDWNQDGAWQGSSQCPGGLTAPEHVLVNFPVPAGFAGPLSALAPPSFLIGPNAGYVWTRFTISETPVVNDWDGSTSFEDGESEDYLLNIAAGAQGDYGDAPEGATAYPSLGVSGQFPTCRAVGPAGFVQHASQGLVYLGSFVDFETDGNAGACLFPPYDQDECALWMFNDPGLVGPPVFTIDGSMNVVPCPNSAPNPFAVTCTNATWGTTLDLNVVNGSGVDAYVNVLMDWNHDGQWQGSSQCPGSLPAPEHVLVDYFVPAGFTGTLSALGPPPFLTGPLGGYVWTRFTISESPVGGDWDGAGSFLEGESEDYLLLLTEPQNEYGDAPEGAWAYPELGVSGAFPTCVNSGPAGHVVHAPSYDFYLGTMLDFEPEGNAGNCPNFPPYDADECAIDGDAGLLHPLASTLDAGFNYVSCLPGPIDTLRYVCGTAIWGGIIDIHVENPSGLDAYLNVLMDWNRDGQWAGASLCDGVPAPEHVLVDFLIPAGFIGPLSGLGPPPFTIGPDTSFVWTRFTISEQMVGGDWNGEGSFERGETEDYLLYVAQSPTSGAGDSGGASVASTRLLACRPNPFRRSTTVLFEIANSQEIQVTIWDVSGRRVRTLVAGEVNAGR